VSPYSGIVSPAYYVLRVSPALLPDYANLLFRDRCVVSQYVVCSKGIGTIQRNLYWPHLKQIGVLVPPLEEQAAIARFLTWASGRLERAIRAKRNVIALLNEQKNELIYRAVTRGTEPEAMLAPSGCEWIGETPKHWQLLRVCRLFRQVARYRIEGNEPKMSMSRHYGLVRSDKLSNRAAQSATSIKYSVCVPGDLVVNKYQAHNGLFGAATERGLITSNYSVFEPIGSISTEYFAYLFASLPYRTEFRMRCQGVGDGMMPLYSSAFLKVPAVVPPLEEQLRIVDFISRSTQGIATAITKLQREIDLLGEYRNRLIADVISGMLDVREAARAIPRHPELETASDAAELDEIEELSEEG
jgi:type I restriction enzyme S subunit